MQKPQARLKTIAMLAVIVATAPLWVALVVLMAVAYGVRTLALYLMVWMWWMGRARRRVVFVYSDSPNWKPHIEQRILPRLPRNTVVLNWSRRQDWSRFSLPVLLFRAFAGEREFNPIALVFARFASVERFRFWQPFRDAKHGRDEPLRRVEAALFAQLEDGPPHGSTRWSPRAR